MNKDKVIGSVKKAGGATREKIGHALGDHKAEALGKRDKWEGEAQKNYGKMKDALKQ